MPVTDLEARQKLARQYRISFVGERRPWPIPDRHRTTFGHVQSLKDKKYDEYATDPTVAKDEPWKHEIKSLALELVEKAGRCSQRNESSWRLACEPLILGRLSAEVCCRMCRKRLWRSEIEARRDGDTNVANGLRERQKVREPCRCPRVTRSDDLFEATGLNAIFGGRSDEEVHHSPEITTKLNKKERPDAVFGLRMTRNIENLLYDQVKPHLHDEEDVQQVQEAVQLDKHPLSQTGDPVLFPFLVLEAKSSSSSDDWESIKMQTAFCIRTLLETQSRISTATGSQSQWKNGPMVWFLANRGENWYVSLAFTETVRPKAGAVGTIEYRVVNLWQGSILQRDGALQLLLLVDYIFDWARDVFRHDVIRELRTLASGENDSASSVYVDSDIFSTLQPGAHQISFTRHSSEEQDDTEAERQLQRNWMKYDSKDGVIRHASLVETKYVGLLVNKDNMSTLLQSTEFKWLQKVCRDLFPYLENAILLTASDLVGIEEIWTGTRRRGPVSWVGRNDQDSYYVVMGSYTYLTSQWHIVRELYTFSIAQDCWLSFFSATGLLEKRRPRLPERPEIWQSSDALRLIRRMLAGTPGHVLLMAINRSAVRLQMGETDEESLVPCEASFRVLIFFIYSTFKKGIFEPDDPFMRSSARLHRQDRRKDDVQPVWETPVIASPQGWVLIVATCFPIDRDRSKASNCIYSTESDPNVIEEQTLFRDLKDAYETQDTYHTTRHHGIYRQSPYAPTFHSRIWNLQATYGVNTQGFAFLAMFKHPGVAIPITQGSSRPPSGSDSESGAQLYHRNFLPWEDTRPSQDEKKYQRRRKFFVLYKLISREIFFWRSIAEDRRARGLSCCECCAAVGPEPVCDSCQAFLDDPKGWSWMKDNMRGRQQRLELEVEDRRWGPKWRHLSTTCQYTGIMDIKDEDWDSFYHQLMYESYENMEELADQLIDFEAPWYPKARFLKRKRDGNQKLDEEGETSTERETD